MRISDWSSDVCSSDLKALAICDLSGQSGVIDRLIPLAHMLQFSRHQLLGAIPERRPQALFHHRMIKRHLQHFSDSQLFLHCPSQQMRNMLHGWRSEEHTSELQSLMRISYAVF